MCFSGVASITAGSGLLAAGKLTLTKTKNKNEIPFASIPLLFGIQQIIEGIVWYSFDSPTLHTIATYAYVMFSHVFWPIFFPLSLWAIENNLLRKKLMLAFSVLGIITGMGELYYILIKPVQSVIINHSIQYQINLSHWLFFLVLYALVSCGSALVSSYRIINYFGVVLFVSAFLANWLYSETFTSVWCFFAAILSVFVYLYLGDKKRFLMK